MSDITIVWDVVNQRGDWAVSNGDLQTGNDLQTAVLLSLFTDRQIPLTQAPPDGSTDHRGWWGDSFEDSPIGSRLWTLDRAIKSSATALLNDARAMCIEALQWLIDDQIAASVQVICAWSSPTQMTILVLITEPNSTTPQSFQFGWAWQGGG